MRSWSQKGNDVSEKKALSLSPPLKVKVRGKDAEAIAVQVSSEEGKETQLYLVGFPGSQLVWVSSDSVSTEVPRR
jgi:hypothetical protein